MEKNNCFSRQNSQWKERRGIVLHLRKSLVICFNGGNWVLTAASALSMCCHTVWVDVYEKLVDLHRYIVGISWQPLRIMLDLLFYSILELDDGQFLKSFSQCRAWKHINKFTYIDVKSSLFSLALWMYHFPEFYQASMWTPWAASPSVSFSLLTEGDCQTHGGRCTVWQNYSVYLKAKCSHWQQLLSVVFLEGTGNVCQTVACLSVFLSRKNGFP